MLGAHPCLSLVDLREKKGKCPQSRGHWGQELCSSEGLSVGLPPTREASGDLISQHPESQSDE